MPGFVDQVDSEGVRGWYVSDDPGRASARGVEITINGEPRYCALCQQARPDVVANGATDQLMTGFEASLALQVGDLVQVRALDSGRLLTGGLAIVLPPNAPEGFLPVEPYAQLVAYRGIIEPLRGHLDIVGFRPMFGHVGHFAALRVRTPEADYVAYRQRQDGEWLARLHREVLETHDIAAPRLRAALPDGDAVSLVVEAIDGRALSHYIDTRLSADGQPAHASEPLFRAAVAMALKLQRVDWPAGMDAGRSARRGRRAVHKLIRSVCLEALQQRRWSELARLLSMASTVYQLPRVFSHGDLHAQNVLVEAQTDRPVFIDWDHAGALPAGFDLSRLLLGVSPALAERWIEASAEGSQACRLGWVILTYFAQAQRQSGFYATQEGGYLRRRFEALSGTSAAATKAASPIS